MHELAASSRAAFARVPAGVAIVTTLQGEHPHGCTGMVWAEAPEPPLLLTTLSRSGTTSQLISARGAFGISLLSSAQAPLTWQFARQEHEPGERFADCPLITGPRHGIPLLAAALASFECELEAVHPFGAHDIVVGRVTWAKVDSDRGTRPVIHYGGRLWQLSTTE